MAETGNQTSRRPSRARAGAQSPDNRRSTRARAAAADAASIEPTLVDPTFVDAAFVDAAFVDAAFVDAALVDAALVDAAVVDPALVDVVVAAPAAGRERTTTLRLPVVTVAVTRHAAGPAHPNPAPGEARATATPASRAGKLAFYGGIAALGVFEVVEWPVAVALGAGAFVMRRMNPAAGLSSMRSAIEKQRSNIAVSASSGE